MLLDLARFAPALVALTFATASQDRSIASLLFRGGLAVASSAIMVIRKHEKRLINAFQHQDIRTAIKEGPGWP
jgi:hypothetical protein